MQELAIKLAKAIGDYRRAKGKWFNSHQVSVCRDRLYEAAYEWAEAYDRYTMSHNSFDVYLEAEKLLKES